MKSDKNTFWLLVKSSQKGLILTIFDLKTNLAAFGAHVSTRFSHSTTPDLCIVKIYMRL
jgi:hypothetical protein